MSTAKEIVDLCKQYTLYEWSAQNAVNPIPVVRAKGIYFWDADDKRYIDFNSQLRCVNIGHGDERVLQAIKDQAELLCYANPFTATEPRGVLAKMLSDVTPGDLNKFFFTNGGAEANENAIKIARSFTGRHKLMARYRSYHGATHGAISLTGDPRRWAAEPAISGVIRVHDPYSYRCIFCNDVCRDLDGCTQKHLNLIEDTIMYEGPHTIAAFFLETVTGTNGIFVPPPGYLKGIRELCTKYGILMVCDEVMSGFGRTGVWFAVDHWEVVPDMICMAKGLTSAYLPLGAVAIREHIAASFNDKPFYGGLTYNAHTLACATGIATLKVYHEDNLIERAKQMGVVMAKHLQDLKDKHPSVGDVRSIGLFGIVELVKNRKTREPMAPFNGHSPEMVKLGGFFRANGLFTFVRWNNFFTNPPLCITEAQMKEAFEIIDRALEITDAAVTE
jgi:taurine---2-oxoglutarate transaminase